MADDLKEPPQKELAHEQTEQERKRLNRKQYKAEWLHRYRLKKRRERDAEPIIGEKRMGGRALLTVQ